MKLFNSLTKKVEDFTPIQAGEVKFYTCGPTVYDHQTIGNLRTYVLYDTLKRTLALGGFKVDHVMNITDVGHLTSDADEGEDKLEQGAAKSGKTVWQVADIYIKEFKQNLKQLNIPEPKLARATDFIDQQVAMVQTLLDKGYAYQTAQAIYFDVSKLSSYGRLTKQELSDKEVGAREQVVIDQQKRHPQDFALWFFRVGRFANHEMNWPSPWGNGFPGWHLECSAIIHSTLGDPIDIHSGAVDLIGTHHTNEMAQTEAAFGNQLANLWVHGEHLLVEGERMGKSLDNFFTLQDVISKGFNPLALRLLYLQAHYRTQLNFTWNSLSAAQITLNNFYAWSDLQFQKFESQALEVNYQSTFNKIKQSMEGDLSTPEALGWFNGMVNRVESLGMDSRSIKDHAKKIDEYFGLELADRQDIDEDQKQMINKREQARVAKDWSKADDLRARLLQQKIEINDTPHGPVWCRVG